MPLLLSDICIVPHLYCHRFHPPESLLRSSSNSLPLSYSLHCRFVTEYLMCLSCFCFCYSCISTSNDLIKPTISSYNVTVPRISTTAIFSRFLFSRLFTAAASHQMMSSYRASNSDTYIIPHIQKPPPLIFAAVFEFTISLTHHHCTSILNCI